MSHYFLCSQNNDSKNYGFYQPMFFDFVAAAFPKTPSPKPARIHPQTSPAGGTEAEVGRIHIPEYLYLGTPYSISNRNRYSVPNGTKLRGYWGKRAVCLQAKAPKFPIKRHSGSGAKGTRYA